MNKDEIKKALRCCSAVGFETSCSDCPYSYRCNDLFKDALNIITEQEKEIERLKSENETYCKQINQAYDTGYNDGYESGKEDGVKEFAEELKAKTMCITEYEDGTRILQTSNRLIDQSVNIFLTNY